jgi:hypothetical protein
MTIISPLPLIFVGLGIWGKAWDRSRAGKQLFLVLFFLYTLFFYSVWFARTRHMTIFLPVITIWMALGLIKVSKWWQQDIIPLLPDNRWLKHPRLIHIILVLLFAVLFLKPLTYPIRKPLYEEPLEYKKAGHIIKTDWQQHDRSAKPAIMALYPWPAFYAGGRHIQIPDADPPDVFALIETEQPDYLVCAERMFKYGIYYKKGKAFIEMFLKPEVPSGFRLVGTAGITGARAYIYARE